MTPRDALEAIGQLPDSEIEIADAALHLARIDAPDADWKRARATLSDLAREAVALAGTVPDADTTARVVILAGLIAGVRGFRGDDETYDDVRNVNLIRVIERRRGMPVALGVLWLHCARAVGWPVHGVDFPGHFLVALPGGAAPRRPLVVDVFAGGVPLEGRDLRALLRRMEGETAEMRPGLLKPINTRSVLLRLQNNIKVRRLRDADLAGALTTVEDMLRIAPSDASLWREAALMNQRLDRVPAAMRCFERFLALVPQGDAAVGVRAAVDDLRSRLH